MTRLEPANEPLWSAYQRELTDVRIRHTGVGCVLALVLWPAGISLDLFGYPQFFGSLLVVRLICISILAPVLVLLYTPFGRRHDKLLSNIFAITPALGISWMVYIVEGAASPFYAGLNLVILGTCLLLPYTLLESLVYCLAVMASYLVACFAHSRVPFHGGIFMNNMIFIGMTATICVTASHYYTLRRKRDFLLRHELDERNRQLTELDDLKSRFFANVSHELRTPLTLILAPVEQLLVHRGQLTADVTEQLEIVERNGRRLLRLIDDLLDLVRIDSHTLKLDRRPIDLDVLLPGLIQSVQGLARAKQQSVTGQPHSAAISVLADEAALEKVVLNLLVNAIKFTAEHGEIRVRWSIVEEDALVEVADTGIGIPPQELPHIFGRFRQGAGPRQRQGLGLGLALPQELVAAHGGALTAESTPGQGSCFCIRLPCAAPGAGAALPLVGRSAIAVEREVLSPASNNSAVAAASATGNAEGATVLVVDDEPEMLQYIASALARTYRVVTAGTGAAAISAAARHRPDLVILDLMLPDFSGVEVCRQLRRLSELPDVKILMLTARMDERAKLDALNAGVDDFLTKPFSGVEVATRIANLLRVAQLQSDLRGRNRDLGEALDRLKATETQLVQSEKMNALGSLAAGLLHEVNNPLNYIFMALGSLKPDLLRLGGDAAESAADIESGLRRIETIVSDLRTFAYPETAGQHQVFDVREALESALRFTAHDLRGVAVEVDAASILAVGSRSQITQVLVNLLLNARDAIHAYNGNHRVALIRLTTRTDGDRLIVAVGDNGCGMDDVTARRVFEPFFTTKDVGQGMGLGLSICHTIVRNHGGRITVRSAPGEGSEFAFDLPNASEAHR